MKAIALYGKKDARIIEKPVPQAEENQLVVKIDYVGICGTDVEFFQSGAVPPFVHLPMVLGHENVGTIVEVGSAALPLTVPRTAPPAVRARPTSASTASPAPPVSAAPTAAMRSICWFVM